MAHSVGFLRRYCLGPHPSVHAQQCGYPAERRCHLGPHPSDLTELSRHGLCFIVWISCGGATSGRTCPISLNSHTEAISRFFRTCKSISRSSGLSSGPIFSSLILSEVSCVHSGVSAKRGMSQSSYFDRGRSCRRSFSSARIFSFHLAPHRQSAAAGSRAISSEHCA